MVTQQKIAETLGISQVLVSYALNGNPRVKESTRELVERTAHELGYQASASRDAKAMRARRHGKRPRSGLIAVVLPPSTAQPMAQLPFYHEMLTGIEAEAEKRGVAVLMCASSRDRLAEFLTAQQVDGIICLGAGDKVDECLAQGELPLVFLSIQSEAAPSLLPRNQQGIELVVQHLIDLGHTAIGYVGFVTDFFESRQRAAGYRSALASAGITAKDEWIAADLEGFTGTEEAVRQLCARSPELTALVCYNDIFAMHAIRALEDLGFAVPRDISVTGFDDVTSSYMFRPAVTSVWFDRGDLGRLAVERLLETDGADRKSGEHEVCEVRLVIRDSTVSAPGPQKQR